MKGIHTGVAVTALLIGASAWSADSKVGAALDDGAVTAKVKAALVGNPNTKARQINVDTSNGVVTLSGTVDSTTAKMSAESTARNITGVSAVENHLMVSGTQSADVATARTDTPTPDSTLHPDGATAATAGTGGTSGVPTTGVGVTTPSDRTVIASAAPGSTSSHAATGAAATVDGEVMQALKADPRTATLQVEVKGGKAGTVTLSGTVPNTADRSAAADVARGVSGVSKVDNKIMVKKGSTY